MEMMMMVQGCWVAVVVLLVMRSWQRGCGWMHLRWEWGEAVWMGGWCGKQGLG